MGPQPGIVIVIINYEPTEPRLPPVVPTEDEGGEGLPVHVGVGDAGAQALVSSRLAWYVPNTSKPGDQYKPLVCVRNQHLKSH
jgi:hypothetical protein